MNALSKMMRPMIKITKQGLRFFNKNANLILTVVSATGVLATVVCAVKGTIKAVKLYEEKKPVGNKEIVKTVWKCYIPTVGMAVLTTTAIICNGRMNAKKIAMLTSAYGSSMEALKRMENKMGEVIGPKKAQQVIDDVHSDSAQKSLSNITEKDISNTGHGNEIFFSSNRLQYMSNKDKLEAIKTNGDRGLMTRNELREIENLPPLPEPYGSQIPARGEYYDIVNPPEGKSGGKNGGDTNAGEGE